MLISKKDLLKETGISYGQLYRWKRERLIPEEWFIKQSSYTGQETYFPKEQILNRIRSIQELKDKYSLEELAKMLSPYVINQGFPMDELVEIKEIDEILLQFLQKLYNRDNFHYIEVLILIILSDLMKERNLTHEQTTELIIGMKDSLSELDSTGYIIEIFTINLEYYSIIYQEQSPFYMDNRYQVVKKIRIDDISNQMKIKYRNYFDFNSKMTDDSTSEKRQYKQDYNKEEYEQDAHQDKKEYQEKSQSSNEDYNQSNTTDDMNRNKNQKNDEIIFKINNWEVRL
ncbi:MAG: DNA-binding protein [Anaerocolumna sp.]|jgi:hypothetical protein|nr:DNA-binding protein [Anaerocolumna sp.]